MLKIQRIINSFKGKGLGSSPQNERACHTNVR